MAKSVTIDFNARLTKFEAGVDKATQRINTFSRNVKRQSKSMSSSFGSLGAKIAGVFGAGALGRSFITLNQSLEQLEKGLAVVSGSAGAAQADLAFLKEVSQDLGLDLMSAGDGFLQLAAAAKGTNLEGRKTRDIFTAVSRAMAKLGRPAEQTKGALYALQQMISKGAVSMEELKRQLGDRLPGALQISARAMQMTTADFRKLVESGSLLSTEFIPKLATELNRLYDDGKKIDTFSASWSRFKTQISLAFDSVDKSTNAMEGLKGALEKTGLIVGFVAESFSHGADMINEFVDAQGRLSERDNLGGLKRDLAEAKTELHDLLSAQASPDGLLGGFLKGQGYYDRKITKTMDKIKAIGQQIEKVAKASAKVKGPDVTPTGTNELKAAAGAVEKLGKEAEKLFGPKETNPLDGMASEAAQISKTFSLIGNALTLKGQGKDAGDAIESAAAAINRLAKEGTAADQTIKDMVSSLNEARVGHKSPELKIIATLEENASGKLLTATNAATQETQDALNPLKIKVIADYSEVNETIERLIGSGGGFTAESEGGRP